MNFIIRHPEPYFGDRTADTQEEAVKEAARLNDNMKPEFAVWEVFALVPLNML